MKDQHNKLNAVVALAPIAVTATNTSAAIDLQGYNSCEVFISCGVITGSAVFVPSMTECATSGGTYTAVAAADLINTPDTALTAGACSKIGYRGNKRYVKVVNTLSSGTSAILSVLVLRGDAANLPVA